ncbi:MAG TPA: YitT family protein, partial [Bacteroidales bacterium]|nr:YitT family protein [Bacteroidales bacterium]
IGRGVTVIDAMGWFTKEKGKVLLVIVRKTESNFVFRVIREIDKNAFISVGSVMGVYGQGFDQIKK